MTDPQIQTPGRSDERVGTLRGAGVEAEGRRVGHAILGICLVAVAVVTVILFIAGAHKNDQINRLRQQGVDVTVTVTRCLGMLGGSGSNAAGYSCTGSFTIGGHRYSDSIPGYTLYPPGTKIRGVTVLGDPRLLSTASDVAAERASWRVFILPIILLVVLVLAVALLVLRRRRRHIQSSVTKDPLVAAT